MKKKVAGCLMLALMISGTAMANEATSAEAVPAEATASEADSSIVSNVLITAEIGDNGREVKSISYDVTDIGQTADLSPDDFQITLGETVYGVEEVRTEGSALTIIPEAFSYDGTDDFATGEHYDFFVDCTMDDFDCAKDQAELKTEWIDDFKHDTFTASNGEELSYWLYMPQDAENVPLMVWEHGGGEVLASSYEGANLDKNKGAVTWMQHGKETAVLSVQYPDNYSFGVMEKPEEWEKMCAYNDAKYELIQELIASGQADENRIYISGASSGGGGVLSFVTQYPDLFAAALPICAKDVIVPMSEPYGLAYKFDGDLTISDEDYQECYQKMADYIGQHDISNVPIWFVHAENDPVCTSYTSTILYQVLEDMGAQNNKMSLYTDEEMVAGGQTFFHSSWVLAFNDQEIIDWVYDQVKE